MLEILDVISGDVIDLILTAADAAAAAAPEASEAVAEVASAAAPVADTAAAAATTVTAEPAAQAAAAAAPAVEAAAEAAPGAISALFSKISGFFKAGGPVMKINAVVLTLLLAIIIERIVKLRFSFSTKPRLLLKGVIDCINDGRIDRAMKICRGEDQKKPLQAPIACVYRAALEKADTDEMEISKTVEDSLMEQSPRIAQRVNFLWPISNAAVLIGLVGTIVGLIQSFSSMGAVDASKRSEVLSTGISEAMNNTAFGLAIAIIGTLSHLLISNRAKKMTDELELYSSRLENILVKRINYMERTGTKPASATPAFPLGDEKGPQGLALH